LKKRKTSGERESQSSAGGTVIIIKPEQRTEGENTAISSKPRFSLRKLRDRQEKGDDYRDPRWRKKKKGNWGKGKKWRSSETTAEGRGKRVKTKYLRPKNRARNEHARRTGKKQKKKTDRVTTAQIFCWGAPGICKGKNPFLGVGGMS